MKFSFVFAIFTYKRNSYKFFYLFIYKIKLIIIAAILLIDIKSKYFLITFRLEVELYRSNVFFSSDFRHFPSMKSHQ